MSTSFSLRVIAVGQASPRWRGAHSIAEADQNNERLARSRADNTRAQVETILRRNLPGVTINPGVSRVNGAHSAGVELGAYGVGSRESLVRVHGDRKSNEAIDRSVKIEIEVTTTESGQTGFDAGARAASASMDGQDYEVLRRCGGGCSGLHEIPIAQMVHRSNDGG
jgi:hypothetical protein